MGQAIVAVALIVQIVATVSAASYRRDVWARANLAGHKPFWIIGNVLLSPVALVYLVWIRRRLATASRSGRRWSGSAESTPLLPRIGRAVMAPLLAAGVAVVVSSIALVVSSNSPVRAFGEMWRTIDSTESVVLIINGATPYYIAGVAVAIGFKMNLFNIGVQGQYLLGALLAAQIGTMVDLPGPLHVTLIILVAVVVGGAWAAVAGVLKVTRNVNEVISTIMLNFIATQIISYLLFEHFRNPEVPLQAETEPLAPSGRIPALRGIFGFDFGRTEIQGFLPIAIAVGIGYYILLYRSRFGYELRVSGMNPAAATSAGVKPRAMVLKTIILSGAVAGLIGMPSLLADKDEFYKYGQQFPSFLGLTGIGIALLGRNHPAGIAAAALVWATIDRATQPLSTIGIPQEIGVILQGAFLLAAVVVYEIVRRRNDVRTAREAADRAARAHAQPPGGGAPADPVGATP
jgi:general nucleoside transport system permease protein